MEFPSLQSRFRIGELEGYGEGLLDNQISEVHLLVLTTCRIDWKTVAEVE